MIEIRVTQLEDKEGLKIINDQANDFLRTVYRPTKAGITHKSEIQGHLQRLVACAGDKVVGTTQYYYDKDCLRVVGLVVHKDYRRQGIASMLLNYLYGLSNPKKCLAVRLATIQETGNVPIFKRLGFIVVGKNTDQLVVGVNGQPVTDVEMERRLTGPCRDVSSKYDELGIAVLDLE